MSITKMNKNRNLEFENRFKMVCEQFSNSPENYSETIIEMANNPFFSMRHIKLFFSCIERYLFDAEEDFMTFNDVERCVMNVVEKFVSLPMFDLSVPISRYSVNPLIHDIILRMSDKNCENILRIVLAHPSAKVIDFPALLEEFEDCFNCMYFGEIKRFPRTALEILMYLYNMNTSASYRNFIMNACELYFNNHGKEFYTAEQILLNHMEFHPAVVENFKEKLLEIYRSL